MTPISIILASVICVFLFLGIERIKDVLVGYGQAALERKEETINLFCLNRLRDAICRKDIYGIEEIFLRSIIKELLTRKYPSPTGYFFKSFPSFRKYKKYLNGLKIMLLLTAVAVIGVTIYEYIHKLDNMKMLVLLFCEIIIFFAIWYSILNPVRIKKEQIKCCKDLYKEVKYVNQFLNDLKNDCNTDLFESREYQHIEKITKKSTIKSDRFTRKYNITIIIPVYNVEKYLKECLHSIVNQTMRNIQIICVNDGSTDNSIHILRTYAKQDKRIEIIDKAHEGAGKARNAAYPYIKGKYVLFVDADDWIELNTCDKLFTIAENTKAQLVQFLFYVKDQQKHTQWYFEERIRYEFYQNNLKYQESQENLLSDKISNLQIIHVWNKLWETSFLRNNNLHFNESTRIGEDMIMSWTSIILANKIIVLPEKLYYHRCIETSLSHSKNDYYIDMIDNYNKIYNFLLKSGRYNQIEYRHFFLSKRLEHYYRHKQKVNSKEQYRQKFLDSLTDEMKDFYFSETFKNYWFQHL